MRMGKHAEALGETRSLTVEGDPAAAEVLAVRAEALYGSGNMDRAMKMYEEVRCHSHVGRPPERDADVSLSPVIAWSFPYILTTHDRSGFVAELQCHDARVITYEQKSCTPCLSGRLQDF